jgi:hypothetical protein
MSQAYPTSATGLTLTVSPADKTKSGTIFTGLGFGYAPAGFFARPSYTVTQSVSFLGDSITYNQGGFFAFGSWAEQAVSIAMATAGLDTHVATAVPWINMSMPGEFASNLASPTGHRYRMSFIGRTKYTLGMLTTNDTGTLLASAVPALTSEKNLLIIATDESARGSLPWFVTVIPKTTSPTAFLNTADQIISGSEPVRLAINAWYRDGAPMDCITRLGLVAGTTTATTARTQYWTGATKVVSASTGAGCPASFTHPINGVMEAADAVETSRNSGVWQVDANVRTLTGCSITPGNNTLTCTGGNFTTADVGCWYSIPGAGAAGIPLVGYTTSFVSSTQLTVGVGATIAVSAASGLIDGGPQSDLDRAHASRTTGKFTADGTHPSPRGHFTIASLVAQTIAAAWTW